jgi:hypothetical protein
MMGRHWLRSVTATAAFAATIPALFASASSAHPSTATKCAAITAGGHRYNVSAIAVKCSFADTWVAVLAKKPLGAHARNVRLFGGPAGYTCQAGTKAAGAAMPDIPATVQIAGNCAKGPGGLGGFGGRPYFNWVVVSKA